MRATHSGEAVNEVEGTEAATATLVALIKAAFPHEAVPESAYRRAAATVEHQAGESAWMRVKLAQGLDSLEGLADGRFTELSPAEALPILRRIEHTTFFGFVRQTVVVNLYEDEEVWQVLGYEGPSFDKGGYLHRGFDDLDWLPEPRIEEYGGEAQVEVVSDLPTRGTTTSIRGAAVPAGQTRARAGRVGHGRRSTGKGEQA